VFGSEDDVGVAVGFAGHVAGFDFTVSIQSVYGGAGSKRDEAVKFD
jgi:hypothetical protein